MAVAKRVVLFLTVNFCVILFISLLLKLLNIQPYLTERGIDFRTLAAFCLVWGMGGSFLSLFFSKKAAQKAMGVKLINPNTPDPHSLALIQMVHRLAQKAGLPKYPDIGVYDSPEVNAFATGASKSNALVAVSTGLLRRLNTDQVEGVLGHEIAHISNGDMVTMTLLQGVINSFVLFLARIFSIFFSRDSESGSQALNGITWALEYVFMFLGTLVVAAFSRHREFKADIGGASFASPEKMVSALNALKRNSNVLDPKTDEPAYDSLKIAGTYQFMGLFATHPPLEERIKSLQKHFHLQS